MKKFNINWTVVKTVTITLALLASLATSFYMGVKFHEGYYENVKSEAKVLRASTATSLKQ